MSGEEHDPDVDGKTVFVPGPQDNPSGSPAPPTTPLQEADSSDDAASAPAVPAIAASPPAKAAGRVEVGAVLNGIYRVERFIARGGMGEVFEGVNINDEDDRVAIKVMLPSLASDPKVQEMFRKEARTLTRLSHPAVVQYRVLAQEPQLGVFYIVTEYIDGLSLADQIKQLRPDESQLRSLIRRLAEGLRAAHELGAVHRDMAPDNVLLPEGRIDRAKIIDFGIAKDLDPSKSTIVGDGFAGKLGYVAPEQFGDFGREVGPWTDVYSLGLVILSVASGQHVDMGATLVEAVDRRRAGPDVTLAPLALQGLLSQMLVPDPARRLRSMDAVLKFLDAPAVDRTVFLPNPQMESAVEAPPKGASKVIESTESGRLKRPSRGLVMAVGGGLLLVLMVGLAAALFTGRKSIVRPSAPTSMAEQNRARQVVMSALSGIPCSWLNVTSLTTDAEGVKVSISGLALDRITPTSTVGKALKNAGFAVKNTDIEAFQIKNNAACARLDTFRQIRADSSSGSRVSSAQSSWTLSQQKGEKEPSVHPVLTLALHDPSVEFTLIGLKADGILDLATMNRATLNKTLKDDVLVPDIMYRLKPSIHASDWYGFTLLTGPGVSKWVSGEFKRYEKGKATKKDVMNAQFLAAAKLNHWTSDMAWFSINEPVKSK